MKIVVSAGPTRERIDAVRFITNFSSGKMGYAIAGAAATAGHQVVLVSGPVTIAPPPGVDTIRVESAAEMATAIHSSAADADAIIMAAAVADYRPVKQLEHKMKKTDGNLTIELERTEDILKTLGEQKNPDCILVGFAAETDNLMENAIDKQKRKNLDWIVLNDVSRPGIGFGSDQNAVTLISRDGRIIELDSAAKSVIAAKILEYVLV
ncbi:MAG: bifunctional phosphopantothenoylcysteine decarboxylase/phosphopantothenate--cysteine ligase CoaBC [Victivallaceae bacterium]|jgi:phosphopantothenoylcysteine decarboxylase/phosphopantothenate--cysteine ligase|nr:bifunctional phosphopantothenoylcysteine decarboxylase/phosphopantothenate--cysteine ligase CoaBC [Victivallaceae bacterium]MDD4318544.1 bifunctional phosphopantothenoylcysteine decarboxylase/phosphopantothenate--cysteine ligase CoaBC [Victivallaceae bacterium]MDD5663232.1 bifunctional phosphopantothenoylcysteine decarboxylase/phosphopantothenate--cysteine ligase CoaBC [Victivallaceae bacterium]NLK82637.1 bifunctional phosphopantothenoylcysteine decarboxylase/phosphopantothenate--cysteine lig